MLRYIFTTMSAAKFPLRRPMQIIHTHISIIMTTLTLTITRLKAISMSISSSPTNREMTCITGKASRGPTPRE